MGESPSQESGLMSDTKMEQASSAIWRGLFRFCMTAYLAFGSASTCRACGTCNNLKDK
jgi:hypothetical protein